MKRTPSDPVALRRDVVARDKRHVWHPYTAMTRYIAEVDPLVVERASGAWLHDIDGTAYLDANSSWWVATLGHNHPRLVRALCEQAERLCHCSLAGITHEPAALLASELCAVAPKGLDRVFFSDDGSTAVEAAVKMALQFWQQSGRPRKTRLLALEGAFHGETVGAASLGGVELFRRPFGSVLFDCIRVAPPFDSNAYASAFERVHEVVSTGADELAAVVVEPCVQGANGMRMYAPEFLRDLRSLCDAHDVLLVADEVFTGYGRTGPMWAVDHAGVAPDILCTAKGFTGGVLPMAATLANARVFDAFGGDTTTAFLHGHSFCGNPLGAAVAREVLAVFEDERVLERAQPKAKRIAEAFEGLRVHAEARAPRSLGMIGAVDLDDGGYLSDAGWRVYEQARRRGAYLRPLGSVVYMAPPLTIEDADLERLLGIVVESVQAALR